MEFTLTEYINAAMALAEFDKLEDGSFAGRIPKCKGVVAFSKTRMEDGSVHYAEIHWYEAHGIGRKRFKIKQILE